MRNDLPIYVTLGAAGDVVNPMKRAMPLMAVAVREGRARRRGVSDPTAAADQVIERLCRGYADGQRRVKLPAGAFD